MVKPSMKCFKFIMFSKDRMETHMENNISLSTPKIRHVSNPREKENLDLAWSKPVSRQGGLL
jgi:hypothetical protein